MPPTLDSALLTGWVRAATQALERHRAEIDRINGGNRKRLNVCTSCLKAGKVTRG